MTLNFDYRGTCSLCGVRLRGCWVTGARINRRSLRTTGGLMAVDWRCHECGFETYSAGSVWALDPESADAVATYRARRWVA